MSDATLDDDGNPYAAILELAERGFELAGKNELDGLSALSERWSELVAGLPEQPPPSAQPLLARATAIHEHTHSELLRLRGALLRDLGHTTQASRAANGYARNVRRRQRLDHSA